MIVRSLCLLGAFLMAACSGGGGESSGGDFVVLQTTPPNNGRLFLNEPIHLDFTNGVDLRSADLNTVAFQVFDLNGNPLDERPVGTFSVGRSPGDDAAGRRLSFTPRFPTNDSYDDGGFRPGRLYLVQLVGGDPRNNNVLKDMGRNPLSEPISFQFRTAEGGTPSELFSDTLPGGPRGTGFSVTPSDAEGVALNMLGQASVEIRLEFDQPLNPNSTNVPVDVSEDPEQRLLADRGRIYLEYDDPLADNVWIPATVDLERNVREGSTVVLRPIGVLPNNADVRVIVETTVEDMSGESNSRNPAFEPTFATFRTRSSFPPQYDALIERFSVLSSTVDFEAPFLEPVANLEQGRLGASFEFAGTERRLDYQPSLREVLLNTDFTSITPTGSAPINVTGGVFSFRNVTIPEGVTVRGTGTNPMVWLCTGDFTVNGVLSVTGGNGARVDTLNSANFPTAGGNGVCSSGSGGNGSPNGNGRSASGEPGFGPNQRPGLGGGGGPIGCGTDCRRGGGGGGGSYSTQGDPFYPPNFRPRWDQCSGDGGERCLFVRAPGGPAGPLAFSDTRADNDFWGSGVNVFTSVRIEGELAGPLAGTGGGGGGDDALDCSLTDPNFIVDEKGGGGGAGGGVLIIQALGRISIGPNGTVAANGGSGGGGEQAGSNSDGGGGGGGSGGMVVMMSGTGFEFWVHGDEAGEGPTGEPMSTYGEFEYTYVASADGGIGLQGRQGTVEISTKYPPGGTNWGTNPAGGFGGMGVIQILAPPGDDSDGTGNRLDDFITFKYRDSSNFEFEVTPERKRELLAWRGWPDASGIPRDDNGVSTGFSWRDGDMRPSPIMLPAPFGALSRARSRWIELGFAAREPVTGTPDPDTPRVVEVPLGEDEPFPDYGDPELGYAGTSNNNGELPGPSDIGYVTYVTSGLSGVRRSYPIINFDGSEELPIESFTDNTNVDGVPAIRIDLGAGASLGTIENRYSQYRAEIMGPPSPFERLPIADFRILTHTETEIFVAKEGMNFPANAVNVRIGAKFFEVETDGVSGVGDPPPGADYPESNTKIGFAFHSDPRPSTAGGVAGIRYPENPDEFVYDLREAGLLEFLKTERPTYVKWDVTFNTRFDPDAPNNVSVVPLSPDVQLPALRYLLLPYRF